MSEDRIILDYKVLRKFLEFVFLRRHMKYIGKARVMSVKKFCEERSGIEILAKNEALAFSIFIRRDFLL